MPPVPVPPLPVDPLLPAAPGVPVPPLPVVPAARVAQGRDGGADALELAGLGELRSLSQRPLHVIDHVVRFRPRLDQEPRGHVGLGMREGLVDPALHLGLGEAVGRADLDGGLLAGAELLGVDLEDTVGVDEEGHLDLGHPRRHGLDAAQLEAGERAVVPRQLALALQHV